MGFKDKLSKTLSTASEKGTEMAGKAKTKLDISTKRAHVKEKYHEIGELYYTGLKEEREVTEDINLLCEKIDLLLEEIKELEESL